MYRKIFILLTLLTFCFQSIKAESYAKHLKTLITNIQERSDIDPDSFAIDIKALETELQDIDKKTEKQMPMTKKATYKAIVRGVMATAYRNMLYSNIHAFDSETQEKYTARSKELFDRVLEDMLTLSKENSKDYEPIIKTENGGKYYRHNMLAVMLDFVISNNRYISVAEKDSLYRAARRIYQMNGDRNSDTMLRLKELHYPTWGTDEEKQQYCRQLEALRDSTRDIDAGQLVSNQLDIAVNNVMAKEIDINVGKNILAGRDFKLEIKSRNATTAKLQVFQFNGKDTYHTKKEDIGKELLQRNYILSDENRIKEGRSRYMAVKDSTSDSMQLPAGRYLFMATTEGDTAQTVVKITTLHHLVFRTPDGKTHIKVVDRISGMPQEGVTVLLYPERNKEDHDTFTTDHKGEVVVASDKYRRMRATRTPDRLNTYEEDATGTMIIDFYNYRNLEEKERVEGNIFTDRGIYRPGQTVHVSAMVYTMIGDDTKVRTKDKYILELANPDGETVESVTLAPDNMGTMTHDFTLPKGKLGRWHLFLKSENSRQWEHISSNSINVEEYKRPTYLPEFRKDTTVYSPEDNIEVELDVRTLSGLPVQNANVNITIEAYRQTLWFYTMSEAKFVRIETQTNDEGKALFDFCPSQHEEIKELIDAARANEKLRVRITAFVTDQAGESHYAKTSYLIPLKPVKKAEEANKPEPLQVSKKEIKVGETVDITFNPEHKDAYVFYYVVANDKIIDSSEKVVNGTMRRTLRCTKDWGDGANIYIMYVKDGEVLHYNKTVKVPKPDKELKLQWHTMRDHLIPGQEEQWTLTVKDKKGKAIAGANLMAAMYDAALDEFMTFDWSFSIPFITNITSLSYRHTQPTRSFNLALRYMPDIKDIMPGSFDYLENFQHEMGNLGRSMRMKGIRPMLREVAVSAKPMESYEALDMAPMAANGKIAGLSPEMLEELKGGKVDEPGDVKPNIRENFNETAFFYPNLHTDEKGNVQIRFTLPESLTEWKFLGFAHTDDVRYGLIQSTAVAQKDFMVQPQLPRFIRTNDDATIQARIQNQSARLISGTATMRLLSAKDESTIITTHNLPFSVEAGKSNTVTFSIPAGSINDDVVCEIFATAEGCSDGERNLVAVLQTRETITENIPFYIEGATTKDIDISTLYNNNSPTATDRTLEIGYTDNPALDVFRALRAVQMPQHDNAPCYAAALYSNIVMISIFDQLHTTSNDTLLHNFDRQKAQAIAEEAASKLQSLQQEDGSWSWFKGMEGSPYITLAVAEHLKRMLNGSRVQEFKSSMVNGQWSMVNEMLSKAMSYLDRYMEKDYELRKKNKWSLTPNEFDLRYMAICDVAENEMLKTYIGLLAKSGKSLTIFGKAKGALILQKFGKMKDARKFTESVKHFLVFKPGFGRYFATDQAYYSWQDYRLPTQMAAMRCMQVIDKEKNAKLLPDMQMWLLRQKQTQLWRNPLNSIDAADYLLTYSKEESLRQADTLQVSLGGETYKVSSTPINPIAPISPSSPFKIEKHSPGISWGYLRGTFSEEAERLNNYTTGELSIQQKIYVKQRETWVELSDDTPLSAGMIIRIRNIIHADRDMDFVSVKTKHPACLEPLKTLSGYSWFGNRGGYLELHDTETDVFFNWFTRGTTTLDLEYYVTRSGTYHSGISTATCEYAPEFGGYSKSFNILVK